MNAVIAEELRLEELFSAIDSKNTEAFLQFLAEDASFRFGSAPIIHGHAAIGDAVNGFFSTIAKSSHRIDKVIVNGATLVCEGSVQYWRLDGKELTIPFVDVFEYQGKHISAYKIYIDIGPLYEG